MLIQLQLLVIIIQFLVVRCILSEIEYIYSIDEHVQLKYFEITILK